MFHNHYCRSYPLACQGLQTCCVNLSPQRPAVPRTISVSPRRLPSATSVPRSGVRAVALDLVHTRSAGPLTTEGVASYNPVSVTEKIQGIASRRNSEKRLIQQYAIQFLPTAGGGRRLRLLHPRHRVDVTDAGRWPARPAGCEPFLGAAGVRHGVFGSGLSGLLCLN